MKRFPEKISTGTEPLFNNVPFITIFDPGALDPILIVGAPEIVTEAPETISRSLATEVASSILRIRLPLITAFAPVITKAPQLVVFVILPEEPVGLPKPSLKDFVPEFTNRILVALPVVTSTLPLNVTLLFPPMSPGFAEILKIGLSLLVLAGK